MATSLQADSVIRLNQKDDLKLEKTNNMLAEKLGAIVGPTYVAGLLGGSVYGFLTSKGPTLPRRSFKLKANYFLNSVMRQASRTANYSSALVFLFLVIGKTANYIFEEELEGLGEYSRVALFGSITGLLYRINYPYQAILLSSALGAPTACALNYGYRKVLNRGGLL